MEQNSVVVDTFNQALKEIADNSIAPEHLATDSVTSDAIAANAVDSAEIRNHL